MLWCRFIYYFLVIHQAESKSGLLLLYRPLDVSKDCAFSDRLRYDLSFGMGMSDTITMVFRTLSGLDYACNIEITASTENVHLIIAIKFPTNLLQNCFENKNAFIIMKKNKCLPLCKLLGDRNVYSSYFVISVKGRLRFRFISNNSINSDMNAEIYQVTATTARIKPPQKCHRRNETLCVINRQEFCFTSGVVCDGIKNCGVKDWFDERQSECGLPIEYLGYAPVIAVIGALACAVLAASHILLRCLPPLTGSFFIFNANEDNRLRIDPVLRPPAEVLCDLEKTKRNSLIPVDFCSSSSDTSMSEGYPNPTNSQAILSITTIKDVKEPKKESTITSITSRLHQKLRSITSPGKLVRSSAVDL